MAGNVPIMQTNRYHNLDGRRQVGYFLPKHVYQKSGQMLNNWYALYWEIIMKVKWWDTFRDFWRSRSSESRRLGQLSIGHWPVNRDEAQVCIYPDIGPVLEVRVTGPNAFLAFWTTSMIDCDGSQDFSLKAVATTFRFGSLSKLSVVTPKWSEYSWTNCRFSRFMTSKE